MDQCIAFLKRAVTLATLVAIAPAAGVFAQERNPSCPPPPQSAVLVLSAKPASVVLNVPTTVRFRLVAMGRGSVQSARLLQGQGGQQSAVPMSAMGSGQLGVFSADAVITAAQAQPVNAVAETTQRLGSSSLTHAVSCMARSNAIRLAVTLPPTPQPEHEQTAPPRPQPVRETVSANGLTLRVPPDWQANRDVITAGGPLALNNFDSRYLAGGIAPKGGAEIDVTVTPRPQSSAQQALVKDLPDVKFITSEQVIVDGSTGTRVWYRDEFGPDLVTTNAAVYVPRGRHLYKFFLTFHADDPQEKMHGDQFRQVLDSVQFKEPP